MESRHRRAGWISGNWPGAANQAAYLQLQIVMAAGQDGPVKPRIRLDSGCAFVLEPLG